MKLDIKIINEIRELNNKEKKQLEIAKILNISQSAVSYWLNSDDKRKEISKKAIERFRSKGLDYRRKFYQKTKIYRREYYKRRYHSDELFRKKEISRHSKIKS